MDSDLTFSHEQDQSGTPPTEIQVFVAGACSVRHRQAVHVSPWAPAGVPPHQDLRHLEEALPTLASACRTLGSRFSADMLLQLT